MHFINLWFDLIWFGLVWFGLVWFDLIWFDLIWFDLIWFDLIWFDGVIFKQTQNMSQNKYKLLKLSSSIILKFKKTLWKLFFSDKKYLAPDTESPKRVNSRQSAGLGESPWKPKRFSNSNQFLPVNKQEEVNMEIKSFDIYILHNSS